MTDIFEIKTIKMLAKRYARASRIDLHEGLDLVASELGQSHWNALMAATKTGWRPNHDDIAAVQALVNERLPYTQIDKTVSSEDVNLASGEPGVGEVQGHAYEITDVLDDVHMVGEGWRICIPEAPNAAPLVEIDERTASSSPVNDPLFLEEAIQIAKERSKRVHARMSTDWSRRSTKPDAEGKVRHPLFRSECGAAIESDVWYCLHCNGEIAGRLLDESLWHCPACGASPIDLFDTPFWLRDGDKPPHPTETSGGSDRMKPSVEIVDPRLKLDLNEENITLLIRNALLDDATNAGERLGALLAEISVDEDNGVWITFETDYWPAGNDPVQALAVAELLGLEVFQEVTLTLPPFAWPGLGELTSSTLEYTRMMLDAYESQSEKKHSG